MCSINVNKQYVVLCYTYQVLLVPLCCVNTSQVLLVPLCCVNTSQVLLVPLCCVNTSQVLLVPLCCVNTSQVLLVPLCCVNTSQVLLVPLCCVNTSQVLLVCHLCVVLVLLYFSYYEYSHIKGLRILVNNSSHILMILSETDEQKHANSNIHDAV